MMKKVHYYDFIELGQKFYLVAATDKGISFISPPENQFYEFYAFYPHQMLVQNSIKLKPYLAQIREYLRGERKTFDFTTDIPFFGSEIQSEVFKMVSKIPYGKQMTSKSLAVASKNDLPVRSIENSILLNPVPIVIPTHRVILESRKTTSCRGGLELLHYLINLEKRNN